MSDPTDPVRRLRYRAHPIDLEAADEIEALRAALLKVDDMAARPIIASSRGVEITPAMVAAGVSALLDVDERVSDYESAVRRIFLAMICAMEAVSALE